MVSKEELDLRDRALDEAVFDAIMALEDCGQPLTLNRGVHFGKSLKASLGVRRVHETRLCASLKRLLAAGRVIEADIEMVDGAYGSARTVQVERVTYRAVKSALPPLELEPDGIALARLTA